MLESFMTPQTPGLAPALAGSGMKTAGEMTGSSTDGRGERTDRIRLAGGGFIPVNGTIECHA